MAGDPDLKLEPSRSCCAVLKERYSKLEEKRNALRQAVKLLEHQIDKLQTENLNVKTAYEKERARVQLEVEAKAKESAIRVGLENEILNLKSEICSLRENVGSRDHDEDGEVILLRTRVSDGEAELSQLKELLEKERKRADSERKKVEAEKKKAAEAWKLVKSEKNKLEEKTRLVEIERSRAEECKLCLETLRTEANEARAKLASEKSKTEEAHKRLEVEKQKANKEKKRADSEIAKSQEQRKCAEEERKKAINEKNCSDRLSQQLEEERRRNETLQKEIQEITSARKIGKAHPDAGSANILVFKKQLKLEKLHVKHAKRVAKLEKVRNDLLQQEICCLKEDFLQFYRRLNILDGFSSHSIEGIDASTKSAHCLLDCKSKSILHKVVEKTSKLQTNKTKGLEQFGNTLKLQSSNLKTKISGKEPCELYGQNENELVKARYTTMDGFDRSGTTLECAAPLSVGSCSKPISGISSELESVIGGSVRNKSQNSTIYSTTTSYSDRPLMGSQGRCAFSVSTSAKLTEENSKQGITFPRLSGDIKKLGCNENLGVVAENNIRSPVHRNSRKKKRLRDAVESIEYLYSEDKQLHLQIGEKLSALHDMLIVKENKPSAIHFQSDGKLNDSRDVSCPVSASLDKLYEKSNKSSKKRKVPQKQKLALQPITDNLGTEVSKNAEVFTQDGVVDAVRSKQEIGVCFEEMVGGDYMKLLELDNAADEEIYRMAMEKPLSPTLPEIEWPILEASESFYSGLANEKDNVMPSYSFNVINVEIDSNKSTFNTSHGSLPHHIEGHENSFEELDNNADGLHFASDAVKQVPFSGSEGMEVPCASNGGPINQRISNCFVVFSNTKDRLSISRIISARKSCISESSMACQEDRVVQKILLALVMGQDLLPEEKACVFFSMLLHNFSVIGDFSPCSNSLAKHMKTVMSDLQTRRILLELCPLNTLLSLLVDFLIDRRVILYNDLSKEPQIPCDSDNIVLVVDGVTTSVSSKTATIDQLRAGSIILASICAAFDHIGFICEASYSILLMHRSDSYFMLTVLHVFASLCGNQYFNLSNYTLIMSVIKSIVTLLERGSRPGFPPCDQCLFSEGAVYVDEVMMLLLEKLQKYTIQETSQHMVESVTPSNCNAPSEDMERVELNTEHELGICGHDMDFDASCIIYKHGKLAITQDNIIVDRTSHQLSDILALVELVAHYMHWDWTCSNTIPQLLTMLESCVSEKYSAAILILLGQLGRLGTDDSGYEQRGVEELRCSLSALLDQNSRKRGLPTQFAIVHALIGLLSLDFGKLIHSKQELVAGTSRSHHANVIRTWFSQLSEAQKSLSFGIFQYANVHEN